MSTAVVSWNPKWGLWGWVINGHGDQWYGIARPRFVAIKMILKQSTTRMARRETRTAGLDANSEGFGIDVLGFTVKYLDIITAVAVDEMSCKLRNVSL